MKKVKRWEVDCLSMQHKKEFGALGSNFNLFDFVFGAI
jgi:hypothetical protein